MCVSACVCVHVCVCVRECVCVCVIQCIHRPTSSPRTDKQANSLSHGFLMRCSFSTLRRSSAAEGPLPELVAIQGAAAPEEEDETVSVAF